METLRWLVKGKNVLLQGQISFSWNERKDQQNRPATLSLIKVPGSQAKGISGSESHSLCCPFSCIFVKLWCCHISLERATATEAGEQSWKVLCSEWLILFLSQHPVYKMYSADLHPPDRVGSWVNGGPGRELCLFILGMYLKLLCAAHVGKIFTCLLSQGVMCQKIKYHELQQWKEASITIL